MLKNEAVLMAIVIGLTVFALTNLYFALTYLETINNDKVTITTQNATISNLQSELANQTELLNHPLFPVTNTSYFRYVTTFRSHWVIFEYLTNYTRPPRTLTYFGVDVTGNRVIFESLYRVLLTDLEVAG